MVRKKRVHSHSPWKKYSLLSWFGDINLLWGLKHSFSTDPLRLEEKRLHFTARFYKFKAEYKEITLMFIIFKLLQMWLALVKLSSLFRMDFMATLEAYYYAFSVIIYFFGITIIWKSLKVASMHCTAYAAVKTKTCSQFHNLFIDSFQLLFTTTFIDVNALFAGSKCFLSTSFSRFLPKLLPSTLLPEFSLFLPAPSN